jgi:hypothetical protein
MDGVMMNEGRRDGVMDGGTEGCDQGMEIESGGSSDLDPALPAPKPRVASSRGLAMAKAMATAQHLPATGTLNADDFTSCHCFPP